MSSLAQHIDAVVGATDRGKLGRYRASGEANHGGSIVHTNGFVKFFCEAFAIAWGGNSDTWHHL